MSNLLPVRYHDGDRATTALLKMGHKHMHCVVIDDCGVRVITEPKENARHCTPLLRRGEAYPIERMVRQLRRVGRERGISAAAEAILDEAVS